MQKKEAVIIGAGNIGAGVVGSLLSNAGYHFYLYDIEQKRMGLLRQKGKYTVKGIGKDHIVEQTITNFTPLTVGDEDALIEKMSTVPLVICCIFAGAFEITCRNLSAAIEKRAVIKAPPLNIVLCVNQLGAPAYFKTTIDGLLQGKDAAYACYTSNVAIAQALVMIAGLSADFTDDGMVYSIALDGEIDIDGDAFFGNVDDIPHFVLTDHIEARMQRKIYSANMLHAALGFMGSYRGYQFIAQCYADPEICGPALKAFDEAEMAMAIEYGFDESDRKTWKERVLLGMGNQNLKDPISRVIANAVEKLSETNRLVGPARLCIKHGIKPEYLTLVIAYALMYDNPDDADSRTIKRYVAENGINAAIMHFCGLTTEEKDMCELIVTHYREISG